VWALPDCGILKRRGKRPEKYLLNGHTRLIDHCSSILRLPLYDYISMPSKATSGLDFPDTAEIVISPQAMDTPDVQMFKVSRTI
jgi:hypothetical protein